MATEALSGAVREELVDDLLNGTALGRYLPMAAEGARSGPMVGGILSWLDRKTMATWRRVWIN